MSRSERLRTLVDELAGEVDGAMGDGGIAALVREDPDAPRRLLAVAARAYTVALEVGATGLHATDLAPTDAVVTATAALKAHDLNPFDLALWFSRRE